MTAIYFIGTALFVSVAVLLSLVILAQKSRGSALFSNAGPVGVSGGPKFVTWLTSGLFGLFLALAVLLNLITR